MTLRARATPVLWFRNEWREKVVRRPVANPMGTSSRVLKNMRLLCRFGDLAGLFDERLCGRDEWSIVVSRTDAKGSRWVGASNDRIECSRPARIVGTDGREYPCG